ncbi:MAG TPA: hypothetical protein VIJ93_04935, partial [bacterium]
FEIILIFLLLFSSVLEFLKKEELKRRLKKENPKLFSKVCDTEIKSIAELYLYKTFTRFYYESRLGKVDIAYRRFLKSKQSSGDAIVDGLRVNINFYQRTGYSLMLLIVIVGVILVFNHSN